MMDRALSWAYLHETDSSFAIEREAPTEDKSRQFIELLKQAHEARALDEEYLVELQNATITNPFDKAAAFRFEQNWLSGPGRGVMSVTSVPPPLGAGCRADCGLGRNIKKIHSLQIFLAHAPAGGSGSFAIPMCSALGTSAMALSRNWSQTDAQPLSTTNTQNCRLTTGIFSYEHAGLHLTPQARQVK